MPRYCLALLFFATLLVLGGCASYTTPGPKADFHTLGVSPEAKAALTDASIRQQLSRRPLVTFPASLAVVRVQGPCYSNRDLAAYGRGNYSVVTIRDIEKDEDFQKIAALRQIHGVAPLRRILLPADLNTDLELRNAAATLHADLLLIYTFDTQFYTRDHVAPLSIITLGAFPGQTAHVTATASAILMDVNNGYVYGVYEETAKDTQLANFWTSDDAMDHARKLAETEAFQKLVAAFTQEWPNVLANYAPRTAER